MAQLQLRPFRPALHHHHEKPTDWTGLKPSNTAYVSVIKQPRCKPQEFPSNGDADITCVALTKEFLIYSTRRGTINYFYLPDFAEISEFRHEVTRASSPSPCLSSLAYRLLPPAHLSSAHQPSSQNLIQTGVTKLFPNELGTRLVFTDDTGAAFLYNPVNDFVMPIPAVANTKSFFWDQAIASWKSIS